MGLTLVTGGTGFVGSHLLRALAGRGDEIRLLARRRSKMPDVGGAEIERVTGSVRSRRDVLEAMEGVERVIHVAGVTSMRADDARRVFEVNVGGTRNVLEAASQARVGRVVHVSSVAAVGPAPPGGVADENQPYTGSGLGIAYVDSKHAAETEALRAAAEGLDVVIVNPAYVLGPDDPSGTSMTLISRFLAGEVTLLVRGGLNVVDVRDVARGILLADEHGSSGRRYILGGRNFTLTRLFSDLSRLSGVPAPAAMVPAGIALRAVEAARALGLPVPLERDELMAASQWWTYRSDRAKEELGFEARPHEETLSDALAWQREHGASPGVIGTAGLTVARAGGAALGVADRARRIARRLTDR